MKAMFLLLIFLPSIVFSEQQYYDKSTHQIRYGAYEINYTVINSTFLTPNIAKAYGLVRSKDQAYVNVSVVKIGKNGKRSKQRAKITGTEYDLIITKQLVFKKIEDKGSIYYFAPVDIKNKIPVYFKLQVRPSGKKPAKEINFKKVLYVQ